tara:strand:- start:2100 stop:2378 length:279 start_codon:yes stop_codon:yes gene_type:complete
MSIKEMIELVQQHHPHMGQTEIVKLLDRAKNDFCSKTDIVKDTYTGVTVAGQRYYDIDSRILKIKSLWLNDVKIPKLIGKPIIDDEDDGEYT